MHWGFEDVKKLFHDKNNVQLIKGWIPEVFEKLDNPGQALQEYLELNKKYPENTEILDRISVLKKTISKT